jgi:hypothetical protein
MLPMLPLVEVGCPVEAEPELDEVSEVSPMGKHSLLMHA